MSDHTKPDWWRDAVFYQVYPRSFQDTNGDGVGDIKGITQHLDYLRDLGVDGLWLTPVFSSPQKDNGYDVSDYLSIDPLFGDMRDMEELIREARNRGIIIIVDMVMNHTSDEHPWFKAAKSSRDNPNHDFYIWRDGAPDSPPDDNVALFGGSAWTYVPELGQYYYHNFSPFQPDLNWANPRVREAMYEIMRFWLKKGAGGFRLDAIGYIAKRLDEGIRAEGPDLHPYLKEMRREACPSSAIMVIGEACEAPLERAVEYVQPGELSMIFQGNEIDLGEMDWIDAKWSLAEPPIQDRKKYWERWQNGMHGRGWNSLYMNNHDLPRFIGIRGDEGRYRTESAKMLAVMRYCLQGTPFVYQGEELGMTNPDFDLEDYRDVESVNYIEIAQASGMPADELRKALHGASRDNARTPMQWSDAPNAGFSKTDPWIPVNPDYRKVNAEAQVNDPDSVYNFYRELFRIRKQYPVFRNGTFTVVDPDSADTFCYTRDAGSEHILVQCNLTPSAQNPDAPAGFADAEVILANYDNAAGPLRPFEARVLYYVS